jgi:uncharacterized protein (DUF488 family)
MKLYTIGFTKKSAETFFELLRDHGIQRLVDIRVNPKGQLSGFAKQNDLPYFLNMLADGCKYQHVPSLAPTKEILKQYREDNDWANYTKQFEALMDERGFPGELSEQEYSEAATCLLCSEETADQCHRRLVAERLAFSWPDVEIIHL